MDENSQAGVAGSFDPEALEYLKSGGWHQANP